MSLYKKHNYKNKQKAIINTRAKSNHLYVFTLLHNTKHNLHASVEVDHLLMHYQDISSSCLQSLGIPTNYHQPPRRNLFLFSKFRLTESEVLVGAIYLHVSLVAYHNYNDYLILLSLEGLRYGAGSNMVPSSN